MLMDKIYYISHTINLTCHFLGEHFHLNETAHAQMKGEAIFLVLSLVSSLSTTDLTRGPPFLASLTIRPAYCRAAWRQSIKVLWVDSINRERSRLLTHNVNLRPASPMRAHSTLINWPVLAERTRRLVVRRREARIGGVRYLLCINARMLINQKLRYTQLSMSSYVVVGASRGIGVGR